MKTLNELSERLVSERKKLGLSQKDMRMLIGMSQQQYQRVEAGHDLKVSTLMRILAGLNLELAIASHEYKSTSSDMVAESDMDDIWASKHKHLKD